MGCEGGLLTTGVIPPHEAEADRLLFGNRNGTPASASARANRGTERAIGRQDLGSAEAYTMGLLNTVAAG